MHIIRRFLFPYARWRTRVVERVYSDYYRIAGDVEFFAIQDIIDQLDLKLGGCSMACTDLAERLDAIAAAIVSAGGNGGGCVVNVSCPTTSTQLGQVYAGLPPEAYTGTPPVTPPEEGTPPDGFDTWQEYRSYKCAAAHGVWQVVDSALAGLMTITGASAVVAAFAPMLMGIIGGSFLTMGPAALATLIGSILAVAALEAGAMYAFSQVKSGWETNKDAIICELYDSGNAADALSAISGQIEDLIQSIEWGAVLGPFAGELAPLFGTIAGTFQNNSLVNPLFQLVVGLDTLGLECPCQEQGVAFEWHFPTSVEGWTFTDNNIPGCEYLGEWEAAPSPVDPEDPSAGCLRIATWFPSEGAPDDTRAQYTYTYNQYYRPVATAGTVLGIDWRRSYGAGAAYAHIVFEDDTYEYMTHDRSSWTRDELYVQQANYGKAIKSIDVGAWGLAQTTGALDIHFDNILLVIP
jgi:hypothetical protein